MSQLVTVKAGDKQIKITKQQYLNKAFKIWYDNGRNFEFLCKELDIDYEQAQDLYRKNCWFSRANQCDEAARRSLDSRMVEKHAEFLVKQEEAASLLRQVGVDYLQDNPIENARDAIAAIKAGIELGRSAINLPSEYKQVEEIRNASGEELVEFVRRLQSRLSSVSGDDVIELERTGTSWSRAGGDTDSEEDEQVQEVPE